MMNYLFTDKKYQTPEEEPEVIKPLKEPKAKFNSFVIANAFEKKDKLQTWTFFRQAIDRGVVIDEISGILFWKIKDMILKNDFRKFSQAELKNLAMRLSILLPATRKMSGDAEAAFEKFLLEAL